MVGKSSLLSNSLLLDILDIFWVTNPRPTGDFALVPKTALEAVPSFLFKLPTKTAFRKYLCWFSMQTRNLVHSMPVIDDSSQDPAMCICVYIYNYVYIYSYIYNYIYIYICIHIDNPFYWCSMHSIDAKHPSVTNGWSPMTLLGPFRRPRSPSFPAEHGAPGKPRPNDSMPGRHRWEGHFSVLFSLVFKMWDKNVGKRLGHLDVVLWDFRLWEKMRYFDVFLL